MKRLLLLLLATAALAPAQPTTNVNLTPDCQIFINTAVVATSVNLDNRQRGCTLWTVAYLSNGFATLSIVVQSAPDAGGAPGVFVTFAGTVVSGVNPNTAITQASTNLAGYFPWLRINLTATTGGPGTLRGVLYGFREKQSTVVIPPGSTVVAIGPDAPAAAPTQNPVQVSGSDGAVVRRILTDTAGRTAVVGAAADGAAPVSNPVLVAAQDGTNVQSVRSDANGRLEPAGISTAQADGISNTQTIPAPGGVAGAERVFSHVFNGSTWDRAFICTNQAAITLTAAGNTQIIALSGSTVIRICHISIAAAAAEDIKITRGTGADCAGGTADVTGLYRSATSLALDFQPTAALRGAAGEAICINQSAMVNAGGVVVYAQY